MYQGYLLVGGAAVSLTLPPSRSVPRVVEHVLDVPKHASSLQTVASLLRTMPDSLVCLPTGTHATLVAQLSTIVQHFFVNNQLNGSLDLFRPRPSYVQRTLCLREIVPHGIVT